MPAFENLRVVVSADVADAKVGLESVERSLRGVEDEAEEAGDALTGLSIRATTAAGGLSTLSAASVGTQSSLTGLRKSLRNVGLIGAAVALTTLPSLTSALLGVGAAASGLALGAGGVFGLSAAAAGAEELEETFTRVRKEIVAVGRVAGEDLGLGGLLTGGLEAVPDVLADTISRISDDLPIIADAMREFGRVAAQTLPGVVNALVELGVEAIPVIRDGLEWLQQNGPQIFNAIVRTARELGPPLIDLGLATADFLGKFNELSTTFTQRVLPAVTGVIRGLTGLLGLQQLVNQAVGDFLSNPVQSLNQALRNFAQFGVSAATSFTNAFIEVWNRFLKNKLNPQTAQLPQGLREQLGIVQGIATLDPISGTRIRGASLNRTDPGVTGSTEPSRDVALLEDILNAINSVEVNTDDTADETSSIASTTEATSRTLQNSALTSRSRCDLAEALLDPFERAPGPGRGSRSRAVAGSAADFGGMPAPGAIGRTDPGVVPEEIKNAIENATIAMDGKKVNDELQQADYRHGRGRLTVD